MYLHKSGSINQLVHNYCDVRTYLLKTNIFSILPETLSCHVDSIFANYAMTIWTHSAVKTIESHFNQTGGTIIWNSASEEYTMKS